MSLDVPYFAARPHDAELRIEFLFTAEPGVESGLRTLPVLGMYALLPSIDRPAEIPWVDAIERIHLRVPVELIPHDVPIPNADSRGLCRQGEPLFALPQQSLCLSALGDVLDGADEAEGLSLRIALDPSLLMNPPDGAIGVEHAMLDVCLCSAIDRIAGHTRWKDARSSG